LESLADPGRAMAVGYAFEAMAVGTRFAELVGCRLPFQLAVLGGVGTFELARAVEGAGGLGMMPRRVPVPEPHSGSLGRGFLIPYLPALEEVAGDCAGFRVAEFFWGDPQSEIVAAAHGAGALVSWQVGSADEARKAEAAGCDLVVAQGIEAGGHVRGTGPLDEVLAAVLHSVSIPVVAAGGIGSASRVAQLISAGADAVRVGTRFLACPECDTHPDYVAALMRSSSGDTVLTDHFDDEGRWPAPVRVLRASLDGAIAAGNRITSPPTRSAEAPLMMACYAGQGVEHVREIKPAAEVVRELTAELA
jgi:NAD(P)H-dependent flavin oxidoreductase YrpB (nitropropane dioxygenase family)